MKWGDYIEYHPEDDWLNYDNITEALTLLRDQASESVLTGLIGFDHTKPYKVGWYIEQE